MVPRSCARSYNAETGETARELIGDALDRLRKPLPEVAALLEAAEDDLFASTPSPATTGRSCGQ
jgi:hypothetical protein